MKINSLLSLNETIDKLFKKVQGFQGNWRHIGPEDQVENEIIDIAAEEDEDGETGTINLNLDIMVDGHYEEISGVLEWDQVTVNFKVMPHWEIIIRTRNPFNGSEISEEEHSFEYDSEYDLAEAEAEENSIEIISTWEELDDTNNT